MPRKIKQFFGALMCLTILMPSTLLLSYSTTPIAKAVDGLVIDTFEIQPNNGVDTTNGTPSMWAHASDISLDIVSCQYRYAIDNDPFTDWTIGDYQADPDILGSGDCYTPIINTPPGATTFSGQVRFLNSLGDFTDSGITTYNIRTIAPSVTVQSIVTDNNPLPTIQGTVDDINTFIYVDIFDLLSFNTYNATINPDGTWSAAVTDALPDGVYTMNVTATDFLNDGLASGTYTVITSIVDTAPPVIEAYDNMTIEATSAAGAIVDFTPPMATDDVDPTAPADCSPVPGSLFPMGTTVVSCTKTDVAGNTANTTNFNITVQDTTAPVIEAVAPIVVNNDPGQAGAIVNFATPAATDLVDPAVIVNCNPVSGSLFPIGITTVTCTATDADGNVAETNFSITVIDNEIPVITLIGADPQIIQAGLAYVELGANVADNQPGAVLSINSASVITSQLGTYLVNYDAVDVAGNIAAQIQRTVNVVDTQKPSITLIGSPNVYLEYLSTYFEQGAIWNDNLDGSGDALTSGPTIDTTILGAYFKMYDYTDANGNVADTVVRNIHVVDTTKPVITLNGSSSITKEINTGYADEGATATDNYDATVSSRIVTSGTVNTGSIGTYQIAYNVTDSEGNVATPVVRTVKIVDSTLNSGGSNSTSSNSTAGTTTSTATTVQASSGSTTTDPANAPIEETVSPAPASADDSTVTPEVLGASTDNSVEDQADESGSNAWIWVLSAIVIAGLAIGTYPLFLRRG